MKYSATAYVANSSLKDMPILMKRYIEKELIDNISVKIVNDVCPDVIKANLPNAEETKFAVHIHAFTDEQLDKLLRQLYNAGMEGRPFIY